MHNILFSNILSLLRTEFIDAVATRRHVVVANMQLI